MARKPKPAARTVRGLLWSTRLRKLTTGSIVGALGAFVTLGAAIKAAPDFEPLLPAHRSFVRDGLHTVEQRVQVPINQLLRWREQDNLSNVEKEINGWAIGLEKESDPEARRRSQDTLNKLRQQKQRIERRIKKLGGDEADD